MSIIRPLLAVAALAAVTAGPAHAGYTTQCQDLIAGQNTVAGQVCVTNDAQYLYVDYNTVGTWTLGAVHLFVGESLATMPQTKTGNPKPGLFPYTDAATGNFYRFQIPLGDFPVACGSALALAAHAEVSRVEADGSVRKETGWGAGTRIVAKGNWATWFGYTIQCPPPSEPKVFACETAFALGDRNFAELGTVVNENRWGWQLTVGGDAPLSGTVPMYAGAGQNDISKGTLVGSMSYALSGGLLTLSMQTGQGFYFDATHVYARDAFISNLAPGSYGHQHDLTEATYDSYAITGTSVKVKGVTTYEALDANGDGQVFVVVHAEVCGEY